MATRSHLHIDILCLLSQGNRCFWSSSGFHSCCCLLSHRNNSTALPRQRAEQSLPSKKSSSQLITAPREQTCGVWSAGPDVPDVPAVPAVPDGFVMWHWWGRDGIPSWGWAGAEGCSPELWIHLAEDAAAPRPTLSPKPPWGASRNKKTSSGSGNWDLFCGLSMGSADSWKCRAWLLC